MTKATQTKLNKEFFSWLDRVSKKEKPPKSVVAYYIGLFESPDGYMTYLSGADSYTEEDDDWCCYETFTPEERYLKLPFKNTVKWEVVLEAVVDVAKAYLASPNASKSILANAKAVAVGFDDGDLVRIK